MGCLMDLEIDIEIEDGYFIVTLIDLNQMIPVAVGSIDLMTLKEALEDE